MNVDLYTLNVYFSCEIIGVIVAYIVRISLQLQCQNCILVADRWWLLIKLQKHCITQSREMKLMRVEMYRFPKAGNVIHRSFRPAVILRRPERATVSWIFHGKNTAAPLGYLRVIPALVDMQNRRTAWREFTGGRLDPAKLDSADERTASRCWRPSENDWRRRTERRNDYWKSWRSRRSSLKPPQRKEVSGQLTLLLWLFIDKSPIYFVLQRYLVLVNYDIIITPVKGRRGRMICRK